MTQSGVHIKDQDSSNYVEVRTITRDVAGTNRVMEGLVWYKAGIPSLWTLTAQSATAPTITLPYSAKCGEWLSSSTSCPNVLLRRPYPDNLVNATTYLERTTTATADDTTVISGARFFLAEKTMEDIRIDNLVYAKASIGVATANTAASAYLQGVDFSLKKLTGADTYADTICSASVTGINYYNATTTVINKSVAVLMKPATAYTLAAGSTLVLEISTKGKTTNASYAATHRLNCSPAVSETFADIYVEEA